MDILFAIGYWVALYSIPVSLLLKHKESAGLVLRKTSILWQQFGPPLAILAGLVGFMMSGWIGLVGGIINSLMSVPWWILTYQAVKIPQRLKEE